MNAHLLRAAVVSSCFLAGLPAAARAQASSWPTEITRRPLTLPQGMVELWAPLQANVSSGREWKPVFLNPSLYYGVTDEWTVGLRHFVGLCPSGENDGCANAYDDVSVDTVYSFATRGPVHWAARFALDWAPIDSNTWSAEVGGLARAVFGRISILVAPAISFGLNDRDESAKVTGTPISLGSYSVILPTVSVDNREYLILPATVQLQAAATLAFVAAIAANGPLNPERGGYGDFYTVPVSLGAVWTPLPNVDVGAHFTWTELAGAENDTSLRIAGIFATWRQ